jgi:dTDP-4-amino-4,6-dideoxygalactose transaminase
VLAIHMSGLPGRIREIAALCRAHDLKLIEDCAQAAGATQSGRRAGSFGDIGVFSLQINKNLTSGEGGIIVCEDESLFRRIVALHDLGYARNTAGRLDPSDDTCQLWGIGARMSELAGAMALAQLRRLPRITGAMREAKWTIRQALADIQGITFRTVLDPAGDSGPFLITLFRDGETATRFAAAISAEGITGPSGSLLCVSMQDWGLHWYFNIPSLVHRRSNSRDGFPWTHPANAFSESYDYGRGALPVCDDLQDRGVILSIGSTLTERDVEDIIIAFRKVARVLL